MSDETHYEAVVRVMEAYGMQGFVMHYADALIEIAANFGDDADGILACGYCGAWVQFGCEDDGAPMCAGLIARRALGIA